MTRTMLALTLTTAIALGACQAKTSADNNTMAADDLNAMTTTDNMGANAMNGAMTASAADQAFLTDAMKGDNSEVAMGKLAQDKGSSQGVKDLGSMLASDHGAHKTTVAGLAQSAGVAVTDDVKDEAKTEMTKLNGLSGEAFDKEFVRATVEDHKKDIAAYQTEAAGTGPVADMAKQTVPTLQKHLAAAEKLQK
jgi:putative membrane protein